METLSKSTVTLVEYRPRSLIPSRWEDTIRILDISESAEAGRSLAHSFATDPVCHYLLDGDDMANYSDEQKWKLHVDIMTYVVVANCYKGIVTSIGPDYEARALWCVFDCFLPSEVRQKMKSDKREAGTRVYN